MGRTQAETRRAVAERTTLEETLRNAKAALAQLESRVEELSGSSEVKERSLRERAEDAAESARRLELLRSNVLSVLVALSSEAPISQDVLDGVVDVADASRFSSALRRFQEELREGLARREPVLTVYLIGKFNIS